MDLYIFKRKNRGLPTETYQELFYARKFWKLLDAPFVREYNESKNDCYVCARITSIDDINQLINIACENRNYWNNYDSVPELLELRDKFDPNDGYTYTLEADW